MNPNQPTNDSQKSSINRRAFVTRLRNAAVIAPVAVAAIASLPKSMAQTGTPYGNDIPR